MSQCELNKFTTSWMLQILVVTPAIIAAGNATTIQNERLLTSATLARRLNNIIAVLLPAKDPTYESCDSITR